MLATKLQRIYNTYSKTYGNLALSSLAFVTICCLFFYQNSQNLNKNTSSDLCNFATEDLLEKYEYSPDLDFSTNETLRRNPDVNFGGWWRLTYCRARYHTAVIIPFRDRADQLPILLGHLHTLMQYQNIDYRIFVVEQVPGAVPFNKALLMNVASTVITKNYPTYDCFIFHDVDMIPEDGRNVYRCGRFPRHLSPAVDEFNYSLPYPTIVGGVLAISVQQFRLVNGFSNLYWGWGAEDDDMYYRIKFSNLFLSRPSEEIGRYTMLKHEKRKRWGPRIHLLIRAATRYRTEGLAQLNSVKYKIVSITNQTLFTRILVDIEMPVTTSRP